MQVSVVRDRIRVRLGVGYVVAVVAVTGVTGVRWRVMVRDEEMLPLVATHCQSPPAQPLPTAETYQVTQQPRTSACLRHKRDDQESLGRSRRGAGGGGNFSRPHELHPFISHHSNLICHPRTPLTATHLQHLHLDLLTRSLEIGEDENIRNPQCRLSDQILLSASVVSPYPLPMRSMGEPKPPTK